MGRMISLLPGECLGRMLLLSVCPLGTSSVSPQALGSRTGGGTSWQDTSGGLGAFLGHAVELSVQDPGFVSRAVLK